MDPLKPKITIEKVTLFVAVAGLFVYLILAECKRKANIELEEKRIESTLYIQAIHIDNKQKTIDNLKFLLKMGAISKDREEMISSLTDSVYLDNSSIVYIKSDTVSFFDFQIQNNNTNKSLFEQFIRGAYIKIESTDLTKSFILSAYTDNYVKAEVYFPRDFGGKFTRVTITKNGYKSRIIDMRFPATETDKIRENIVMDLE